MLINAASRRMATYLQCLKETFADPEILRAEWIDLKDNVFSINYPVKGYFLGKYALSPRLVAMLNALPRKDKRIFSMSYKCALKIAYEGLERRQQQNSKTLFC